MPNQGDIATTTHHDAGPLGELGRASIPPLEAGDRLTRDEFERRYDAMPELKKAELIEGVVYMPAAVRLHHHSTPHGQIVTWLFTYQASTPGVIAGDNASARLDLKNMPQPDGLLMIDPVHGGQALISEDDYVERAPELVAEIASSSLSVDMNAKFNVYLRCGVREYVVWRVRDKQIDWFVAKSGQFEPLAANERGRLCSTVFPGLWLDHEAMLRGNLKKALDVLQEGLDVGEHAAFVARLAAR